jgi:hypothetical protein
MTGLIIGSVIGWELSGSFRQTEARSRAAQLGLAEDFRFPRIEENSVYRRAVNAAVKGGAVDNRQYVAKIVEDSPLYIAHEILSASLRDISMSTLTDKSALYTHETTVRFDKMAYADMTAQADTFLQVEDPAHPIAARIIADYTQGAVEKCYSASDVRVAFQRAFVTWAGLRILSHGGMWFIPSEYADKVAAWAEFVGSFPGCRASVWQQVNVQSVMDEVARASADTLEAQLAEVLTDLERFAARETVRLSTLEDRITVFDALRARAELFERLLGHSLGDIKDRMVIAQEALVGALYENEMSIGGAP